MLYVVALALVVVPRLLGVDGDLTWALGLILVVVAIVFPPLCRAEGRCTKLEVDIEAAGYVVEPAGTYGHGEGLGQLYRLMSTEEWTVIEAALGPGSLHDFSHP